MRNKVCLIGTGYVGMASGLGLAELGWNVIGYDILPDRIAGLRAGITPYQEDGINELLQKHLASQRISFVDSFETAIAQAGIILIAVGTPAGADGAADLSGLHAVVDAILASDVPASTVVVIRSTVPPGTSDEVARALRDRCPVLYAPEFLREGSAVPDFLNPDRIVIGGDDYAARIHYAKLFERLERPILFTSRVNAELIKGWSNAFLAMKISFANEVANFCAEVGADSDEVLRGIGYDKRIGEAFLAPGIGFGGPCFEKDVKSMVNAAAKVRTGGEILSSVLRVNDVQPKRIVDTLAGELGSLEGAHIGVWGLAFKAGTSDVRDSLAMRVIADLIARGASVAAYDPAVRSVPIEECAIVNSAIEAASCDALLILTEWPEFKDVSLKELSSRIKQKLVVDGRNLLDPERVVAAGLKYNGVGRSVPQPVRELASVG
ncbi:MAG: UDP-glucose/GDP-mannose dehydrogenase family protein [Candidatus Eremiobacteraeota bacterium]|nr:UDP-glucose/GDP-mannose dehydrogenase family protein [Candidatus Eremiobacteraeota bacterium]